MSRQIIGLVTVERFAEECEKAYSYIDDFAASCINDQFDSFVLLYDFLEKVVDHGGTFLTPGESHCV